MSPNEINVLRIFEKTETAGKGVISKGLGVSTDYAQYLCLSLFRKGYLESLPSGQYGLTKRGMSALFEHLLRVRNDLKRNMMLLDERVQITESTLVKLRERQARPNL